ncbi:histidine kinase [Clostridium sp. PL3]|uniref:Histidine kinase n=1 Tax=Clostridium thailandense TaxID=2794346 RepID=A0A949X123_9CLOT|nr:histidine kinase [Clostridium thailandense]MBV7271759.1 histidine kinase [Clostridium thailandense]
MKGNIQSFEWGYIEWIYEPDSNNPVNNMSIGIVTILPNKRQNRHIHYGDEQVMYVLSGEGDQLIGDIISNIKAGQIYHMEAGIIHETINTGDEAIKHLLISIPVQYEQNMFMQKEELEIFNSSKVFNDTVKIDDEISYIYEALVNPLKMPVAIFDLGGKIIIKGRDYPEFCKDNCLIDKNDGICPMYSNKGEYAPPQYKALSAVICPHGLTVFTTFITLNNKPIGMIKGGHIQTVSSNSNNYDNSNKEIHIVPKGTLNAVLQQLKKLSKAIENYYVFKNVKIELSKKEEIIRDIIKNEIALEESLKLTKEKILNIQINNHFLFNTLNNIASLAVKEDAMKTYQSIIDISKTLRYTAANQNHFVQLKSEIEFLKNYTNLQKLKYGERLKINIDASTDINNKNVPFNCLQPIVENCFVHGFKNINKDMKINIIVKLNKDYLIIDINDNGMGLNEENLDKLRSKISEYEKYELRGLMMVYYKLRLFYGENFDFKIESSKDKGTNVRITLPEYIT